MTYHEVHVYIEIFRTQGINVLPLSRPPDQFLLELMDRTVYVDSWIRHRVILGGSTRQQSSPPQLLPPFDCIMIP